MVITTSTSALEEWHNLASPPPTFHPGRAEESKEKQAAAGSIGNTLQSSTSSLTDGEKADWETTPTEKY